MDNQTSNQGRPQGSVAPEDQTTRAYPPHSLGAPQAPAPGAAPPPTYVQPGSSYGGPAAPPAVYRPPVPAPGAGQRERSILAAVLIVGGLLFFLQQFITPFFDFGVFVLPLVGAAFLFAYFNSRAGYRLGFLIPGAILLGIGVGELVQRFDMLNVLGGFDVSGLALGLGFILIWALERRQWWALIPGGILTASSLGDFWMLTMLWPLGLVLLGAYLLYDQYRRRQKL